MTRWQEQVTELLGRREKWKCNTTGPIAARVETCCRVPVDFTSEGEAASFLKTVNAGPCGGLPPGTLLVAGVDRVDVAVPLLTGVAVEHRWKISLAFRPGGWNGFPDPLAEYHRLKDSPGEVVYPPADFDAIRDEPGA